MCSIGESEYVLPTRSIISWSHKIAGSIAPCISICMLITFVGNRHLESSSMGLKNSRPNRIEITGNNKYEEEAFLRYENSSNQGPSDPLIP